MRIVGVIAEYQPFHRGHAYHLAQARRLAEADAVLVVMSTCFTQRGDAALLSPAARAEMALACGADVVIALPTPYAVRDAEHFALSGVHLLSRLGCAAISFGAETADASILTRVAYALEAPSAALSTALHHRLAAGQPYPEALCAALSTLSPESAEALRTPNNTLAVCYLRAMRRLGAEMAAYPVARASSYHRTDLSSDLPSATAVRGAILRGNWTGASRAMPEAAYAILRREALAGRLHRPEALDLPLLYRLRTMTSADYAALPDISEGIENRLRTAAQSSATRAALLDAAKTRRYPYARLSRLCTHALLEYDAALLSRLALPGAAWLLGVRSGSEGVLAEMKKSGFPLLGRAAEARSQPWFPAECRAYDLWALGVGMPAGLAFTQKLVKG